MSEDQFKPDTNNDSYLPATRKMPTIDIKKLLLEHLMSRYDPKKKLRLVSATEFSEDEENNK